MKVEKEEKAKGERTVSELDIGSERQNITTASGGEIRGGNGPPLR